jgi:uncharacterized protein
MIGRKEETSILLHSLVSNESEMIAVVGRRRVGKTYLIKEVYKKEMTFYLTGMQFASKEEQIKNFVTKLKEYFPTFKTTNTKVETWGDAFTLLTKFLQKKAFKRKPVIFFDELPWLATNRSGFVEALGYFWNNYGSTSHIVVVICGSAASWMLDNVVNQKGSLYNRITKLIKLEPFTLYETEQLCKSVKCSIDVYQIAQVYMAMGGIPHYLKEIRPTETAIQFINRMCFTKTGMLRNEFENLYAALFDFYENHLSIVEALASKWKGLTRAEIIKLTNITNGGGLTKVLRELEASSFITAYLPYGKLKRESLYRLTDEYSLFYLKFIKNNTDFKQTTFLKIIKSGEYHSWSGYAFESLCLKHVDQIKLALGIPSVHTQESSFIIKGSKNNSGSQIDLLIDREDRAINICEMKYVSDDFKLTKEYATTLRKRRENFKFFTKTKKHVFTSLITTYGMDHNEYSLGLIDNIVTLEDLFKNY